MSLGVHFRDSFAPHMGATFFSIHPILIQIDMLGLVSILMPYLISNIKGADPVRILKKSIFFAFSKSRIFQK